MGHRNWRKLGPLLLTCLPIVALALQTSTRPGRQTGQVRGSRLHPSEHLGAQFRSLLSAPGVGLVSAPWRGLTDCRAPRGAGGRGARRAARHVSPSGQLRARVWSVPEPGVDLGIVAPARRTPAPAFPLPEAQSARGRDNASLSEAQPRLSPRDPNRPQGARPECRLPQRESAEGVHSLGSGDSDLAGRGGPSLQGGREQAAGVRRADAPHCPESSVKALSPLLGAWSSGERQDASWRAGEAGEGRPRPPPGTVLPGQPPRP